jgi:hypothetical protein
MGVLRSFANLAIPHISVLRDKAVREASIVRFKDNSRAKNYSGYKRNDTDTYSS